MLTSYYRGLQERERIVLWLGVLCVLVLLVYLVGRSLLESNQQLREQVSERQTLVSWMENAAAEVKSLSAAGPDISQPSDSIQQIITDSANRLHLALQRMKSGDANQVQVQLDNAEFSKVMELIQDLHSNGVILRNAQIQVTETPGKVNGHLNFDR